MPLSKKINVLLILLLLIIALVIVVVSFLNAKVNFSKKAAGSGVIRLTIANQSGASLNAGEVLSLNVNLTSTQLKQVRVAGTDLSFDQNVFTVASVTCGSIFPSTARATSSGNKIYLSCFRPAGAAFSLAANQTSILGTVRLQVKSGAPGGSTNISFSRTKIPEAGNSADISDGGTGVSVNISGGGGQCPLKGSGDADCNQIINITDFNIWRGEFLYHTGLSSDFNQNGTVEIRDFTAWRTGFLNSLGH